MRDNVLTNLQWSLFRVARAVAGLRVTPHALGMSSAIDRAGYAVLGRLAEAGPIRLSDLAALLGLDTSTVSRQVRALDEEGLVRRAPDPDDGRACLLAISRKGERVHAAVTQARCDLLAQAVANWPASDQTTLARLLGRLAEDLQPQISERAAR